MTAHRLAFNALRSAALKRGLVASKPRGRPCVLLTGPTGLRLVRGRTPLEAVRLARKLIGRKRPGAPKGNRNGVGWPAKRRARIEAELRGELPSRAGWR